MCDLIEVRPQDTHMYLAYVSQMYARVHWSVCSLRNDEQWELCPLTEFYMQPQTEMTRAGILSLLEQIRKETDFHQLVMLQQELTLVRIEFDAKYELDNSEEGPYTFFYFIYQNPQRAIMMLNCAAEIYSRFGSTTHHILEYLLRLGTYVAGGKEAPVCEGNYMRLFLWRSLSFLGGIEAVRQQLADARVEYVKKTLIPTNGDMHCGGKVPCFIDYSGERYVYKPRDMRIDRLTADAFAYCSQFLPEKMRLPSLQVRLLPDTSGMMEFAIHAKQMNSSEAKGYFTKFGVLLCFAKLFGVRDLHYENIIATRQGPVIIDMECALNPVEIQSQALTDMSLVKLKAMFSCKIEQNATFQVEGKIPSLREWEAQICDGFAAAAACLYDHRPELADYYRRMFAAPLCYRIVPVSTEEFYGLMHRITRLFGAPSEIMNVLLTVYDLIFQNLCSGILASIPKGQVESCLKKEILLEKIYNDLLCGNIPFMQMKAVLQASGSVFYTGYIDGCPFFKQPLDVTSIDRLSEEFNAQIEWLNSGEAQQALQTFIER